MFGLAIAIGLLTMIIGAIIASIIVCKEFDYDSIIQFDGEDVLTALLGAFIGFVIGFLLIGGTIEIITPEDSLMRNLPFGDYFGIAFGWIIKATLSFGGYMVARAIVVIYGIYRYTQARRAKERLSASAIIFFSELSLAYLVLKGVYKTLEVVVKALTVLVLLFAEVFDLIGNYFKQTLRDIKEVLREED